MKVVEYAQQGASIWHSQKTLVAAISLWAIGVASTYAAVRPPLAQAGEEGWSLIVALMVQAILSATQVLPGRGAVAALRIGSFALDAWTNVLGVGWFVTAAGTALSGGWWSAPVGGGALGIIGVAISNGLVVTWLVALAIAALPEAMFTEALRRAPRAAP